MGREVFPRICYDEAQAFLDAQGVGAGSFNDRWMEYWQDLSSLARGTMYDHIMDVLDSFPGTVYDKLYAWAQTNGGGTGTFHDVWCRWMVEGQSGGGADAILLETGDGFLLETGDALLKE